MTEAENTSNSNNPGTYPSDRFARIAGIVASGSPAAMVTSLKDGSLPDKEVIASDTPEWNDWEEYLPEYGYHEKEPPVRLIGEEGDRKLIEFFTPKPRAIIYGGGHIAIPLAALGEMLGFSVIVFDDRPAYANTARFPNASQVICEDFAKATDLIDINANDYVIIVTRGHAHDSQVLRGILSGPTPAYTGMIGSRRRVGMVREKLVSDGFPKADVDAVHSPIGLSIGAVTPEEIAVSVFAEIISVRRQGVGGKGKGYESSDMELVSWLAENDLENTAIATVISVKGSAPRQAGAKMAIRYDGFSKGSIGGGCAESDVITRARSLIRSGGWELMTVDLTDDVDEEGMVCGGTMDVLIEAFDAKGTWQ